MSAAQQRRRSLWSRGRAYFDAILADTDLLTDILTYHVIAGELRRAPPTWLEDGSAATVEGRELHVLSRCRLFDLNINETGPRPSRALTSPAGTQRCT